MWWYNIYMQYICKFGYHYKNSKISKLGTYHRFSDILKDCSQACRPVPINAWDWSEQDVLTVENVVFNRVEKHFGRMKIHECQLCSCFLFMFFHRFSTQNFNSFYRWPLRLSTPRLHGLLDVMVSNSNAVAWAEAWAKQAVTLGWQNQRGHT